MSNLIQELEKKNLIQPPSWLSQNLVFLGITGSISYGISSLSSNLSDEEARQGTNYISDMDIIGITIPKKEDIFPTFRGEIPNFGTHKPPFLHWQQHHVLDKSALNGKGREYDLTIYSIVKYFDLAMNCNPNMLDILFLPHHCILLTTPIFNVIRENKKLFIHKGIYHKFVNYAASQHHKMNTKNPTGKRKEVRDIHGFDLKFAVHIIRLMLEAEMLLTEGDLDLMRHKEFLKGIRRGEWSQQQINDWFESKEKHLEKLYQTSTLPSNANEDDIKKLLLKILEMHYGSLSNIVNIEGKELQGLRDIRKILDSLNI